HCCGDLSRRRNFSLIPTGHARLQSPMRELSYSSSYSLLALLLPSPPCRTLRKSTGVGDELTSIFLDRPTGVAYFCRAGWSTSETSPCFFPGSGEIYRARQVRTLVARRPGTAGTTNRP